MDKPIVSIECITYNHEPYIRQTIEGFLMQKTSFPFEIIIHDDASTDQTQKIIHEYEVCYPDLIKPIYQTRNQYSQHINFTRLFIDPKVMGKYVAFCEGDDYWIDSHKLQKQVDYMEANPDCSMTMHASNIMIEEAVCYDDVRSDHEVDYTTEECIKRGGGYWATASLVCRAQYALEYPVYRELTSTGDSALIMHMALNGRVHYFPEIMAVHRTFHVGSWSANHLNNLDGFSEFQKEYVELYQCMNNFTDGKYKEIFEKNISTNLQYLSSNKNISIEQAINIIRSLKK